MVLYQELEILVGNRLKIVSNFHNKFLKNKQNKYIFFIKSKEIDV